MNYTVLYVREAERELIELWLHAEPRDEITRATDEIDLLLGMNPTNEGESRGAGIRILVVLPLAAFYTVSEDDRTVHVLEVHQIPRRRRAALHGMTTLILADE
jgi:hypothetical protein